MGALDHFAAALRLYRLLSDSLQSTPKMVVGEANVLKAQSDVPAFLDQRSEALAKDEEALGLFQAVGARLGEANVLQAQSDVHRVLSEYDASYALYTAALDLYRGIGAR